MPLALPYTCHGPVPECKKCLGDETMEEADEYEDFSFDLCFECATLPPPVEILCPYRMLVAAETIDRDQAMSPFSRSYPPDSSMLHPSAGSFHKKEASIAMGTKKSDRAMRPTTKKFEFASALDDDIIFDDVSGDFAGHIMKNRGSARFSKSKTSHHKASHQLVAIPQDCIKCSRDTSFSMKCTEDDCEFSFDLCFECAGTGPPPPVRIEDKTMFMDHLHTDPGVAFDYDFEALFSIR